MKFKFTPNKCEQIKWPSRFCSFVFRNLLTKLNRVQILLSTRKGNGKKDRQRTWITCNDAQTLPKDNKPRHANAMRREPDKLRATSPNSDHYAQKRKGALNLIKPTVANFITIRNRGRKCKLWRKELEWKIINLLFITFWKVSTLQNALRELNKKIKIKNTHTHRYWRFTREIWNAIRENRSLRLWRRKQNTLSALKWNG